MTQSLCVKSLWHKYESSHEHDGLRPKQDSELSLFCMHYLLVWVALSQSRSVAVAHYKGDRPELFFSIYLFNFDWAGERSTFVLHTERHTCPNSSPSMYMSMIVTVQSDLQGVHVDAIRTGCQQ